MPGLRSEQSSRLCKCLLADQFSPGLPIGWSDPAARAQCCHRRQEFYASSAYHAVGYGRWVASERIEEHAKASLRFVSINAAVSSVGSNTLSLGRRRKLDMTYEVKLLIFS